MHYICEEKAAEISFKLSYVKDRTHEVITSINNEKAPLDIK